jgi:CRP-like cAMP-binding protein
MIFVTGYTRAIGDFYVMCKNTAMLLSDDKLECVTDYFMNGVRGVYKKGEVVIRPQDTPEHIYFIESGFVKAFSITKYGDENVHVIRHNGEIFPLIWTFTEDHRDVAYEALEQSVIWRQPKQDYLNFLAENPDATTAVLGLAMRAYRTFAEHVNTLEYRTVRERVVSFLLSCCRRFGETLPDGSVRILCPLKQQDIASSINASRETTSRELSGLARKNLITIDDRHVIVHDWKKLESYV